MFDSVPSNLPFEPTQPSTASPPRPMSPVGPGRKEPEDIFAEIKDPGLGAENKKPFVPQTPTPQKTGSKVLILLGIPLVVIALGVGGWYLYGSLTQGSGVNSPQQKGLEATVPSSNEPDNNGQTIQNPMPTPDDSQLAASQASIGILQAQQQQALEAASSTLGATSTEQVVNIPVVSGQEASSTPVPANIAVPVGADQDQDGLTDAEEALLGTDPALSDSDGDGFDDLSELKNGYDPASRSGKLENSSYIKNETIGSLRIMIPKSWVKKAGMGNSIVIDTGTPASFTIYLEQFASAQTLLAWLTDKYPGSTAEDYVQDKAKNGDTVIYSKDKTKAWLLSGNTVYSFSYSTNGQTNEYGELFDVMVKQAQS